MAKLQADVFLFIQDLVVSQQLPKHFHLCCADLTHSPTSLSLLGGELL